MQDRMCGRRLLALLTVVTATASFGFIGSAKADTDGIVLKTKVPVTAVSSPSCPGFTPTFFSFDISWVDPFVRAYFLADRTHGGASNGDVLMVDINNLAGGPVYITPPSTDPFAGIRCDANAAFGGTTGAGRNEITGPNGLFTVNHSEIWVGDGPAPFTLAGQTNKAADYANDLCNSSVRVFDIASRTQTDHINVGGCFRTDEGAFDPDDQIALFANPSEQPGLKHGTALNNSSFITLISTRPVAPGKSHKILSQINFDGTHGTVKADMGIEQAVYSRKTGLFYIAIPGASSNAAGYVAVVDPSDAKDIKVTRNFKLQPVKVGPTTYNCAPNGAALGPDYELYLGCGAGPEEVIDIRDGHVIKTIVGTTGGCDEVYFNAGDDHFIGACTDSNVDTSDNLDISDADPVKFDQAIDTFTKGAHSVAADPVTVQDFVPATLVGTANPSALCGASPCILVFGSTGGDDKSEFATETAEDNHRDRDFDDNRKDRD